jgi:hypothetical protein
LKLWHIIIVHPVAGLGVERHGVGLGGAPGDAGEWGRRFSHYEKRRSVITRDGGKKAKTGKNE